MPSTAAAVGHPKKAEGKAIDLPSDRINDRGASKSTEKTKNVSHVPCKFFRQSMCQAGDKCPFSHELEADTQAICKYFQRGNCRFGSKCALAHITPDGRRVNKKPVKETRKKERVRDERKLDKPFKEDEELTVLGAGEQMPVLSSSNLTNSLNTGSLTSSGLNASSISSGNLNAGGSLNAGGNLNAGNLNAGSLDSGNLASASSGHLDGSRILLGSANLAAKPKSGSNGSIGSDTTVADSSVELASQILSKYSGCASPPQTSASMQSFSMRSFSANLPRLGWSGMPLGISEGSAVYDDDDTLEEHEFDEAEEEEEGYKEQLVPSALQDLLTPLERERRNSRNSQQKSGRVFSSPASSAQPATFGIRRGSASSEPMSAPSPNTLWGPRNPVAPFYRPGQFGSPPIASSQLSSPGLTSPHQQHTPIQQSYQFASQGSSMPQSLGMYVSSPNRLQANGSSPIGTTNGAALHRPF